jgi:hypothetical protein
MMKTDGATLPSMHNETLSYSDVTRHRTKHRIKKVKCEFINFLDFNKRNKQSRVRGPPFLWFLLIVYLTATTTSTRIGAKMARPTTPTVGTFLAGVAVGIVLIKWVDSIRNSFSRKLDSIDEKKNAISSTSQNRNFVDIVDEPLSIDKLILQVETPRAGAIVTFSGVTRDNFEGKEVLHLE